MTLPFAMFLPPPPPGKDKTNDCEQRGSKRTQPKKKESAKQTNKIKFQDGERWTSNCLVGNNSGKSASVEDNGSVMFIPPPPAVRSVCRWLLEVFSMDEGTKSDAWQAAGGVKRSGPAARIKWHDCVSVFDEVSDDWCGWAGCVLRGATASANK